MDLENVSCSNNTQYSLVNFSYSDCDNESNNDNGKEEENKNKDIIKHIENDISKTEKMKKSDIFNLSSTLIYQEKFS